MSVPMRQQDLVEPQECYRRYQSVGERRPVRRRRKIRPIVVFALALAAVCLGAGFGMAVTSQKDHTALRLLRQPPMLGQVDLASAQVARRLGFVTVTGNIQNRSSRRLTRVEAVVELLDAQNQTVGLESGLIAFDPLPARAAAPFRVVMQDDARAVSYRVRFRELLGELLD